ncbi:hypothetical protein BRADI_1g20600v3 [Brachypodium distachyon]|uniref:Uncharacterized protein n=1 Tax=Brachypodium distachyon TaxID=15368 RepID=I1GS33_BRADI|nr:hypothetical protein BRADI_1g20600v3 [Brachypodium distachyon]
MGMRHPDEEEEPPSPRPSASAGCYAFLRRGGHGSTTGYRRLESSTSVVRVEVGKARSVYHVDAAVLEAEPVRRLLAAAGRRGPGAAVVAVAVDALLFEHLLWLADDGGVGGSAAGVDAADLSEIVEFYSQDDEDP